MNQEQERADRVFAALGNTTRRDILRRTADTEQSVSSLARHYAMSLAAVQKHVAVLEHAELVTKRRHGREQLVSAEVTTVRDARRQLEDLEALWRGRIERFGAVLAEPPHDPSEPTAPHNPSKEKLPRPCSTSSPTGTPTRSR